MDTKAVAPKDVVPDALILQTTSKAGSVEGDAPAVRVPYVSFEGQPEFVPEGDAIDLGEPEDREVLVHTGKVALLVPVSREQFGQPDVASLLSDAAKTALIRKANRAYLRQAAPVGPAVTPPAGLLNQGVSTVVGDPVELDGTLDAFVDAVAQIEAAGGTATHILIGPAAWAAVQKLKLGADSHQSLVGAGTGSATRQLLNLPVLVDRDVNPESAIVLDRKAILSVYGNVQIATSTDYLFNQDSVALRITWRFGAKIADTNRVVALDILDHS